MSLADDPRLVLREEELDTALELLFLTEAALWSAADAVLDAEPRRGDKGLGRTHYRTLFLLKRRPGLGVRELSRLMAISKQGASRALGELAAMGLVQKEAAAVDARRRPAVLTREGAAVEARVSERLRALITRAYRAGGLEHVGGARRILAALAGGRASSGRTGRED